MSLTVISESHLIVVSEDESSEENNGIDIEIAPYAVSNSTEIKKLLFQILICIIVNTVAFSYR